MDRIQAMQVFLRVVETGSFTKAAETLSMAPSSVTSIVKNLEEYLQVRLLQRTTRSISLTPDGERYHQRCRGILQTIEEAEAELHGKDRLPRGRLRVDMPGSVARALLFPRIKEFHERFPEIDLMIGLNDKPVDLVQEGVDCVIRTGELRDSALIARRLGSFRWITCGAPSYFEQHGVPLTLEDLVRHRAVHYFSSSTGRTWDFRFLREQAEVIVPMEGTVAVNDTEGYIQCSLQGLGLIQLAEYLVVPLLESGHLVEVLAENRRPLVSLSLVYPNTRHLSPVVRAFIDWMTHICAEIR
ncbi:LysR family transcriptional regulator [Collimonas sp. NPDC087041]|uniref:LysR family transcriptional regulator n=1 Tax=Collimonas sp. NPDC087041 TaxID=3363960 RepID=UPI0037FF7316